MTRGESIKNRRLALGLSIVALARLAGTAPGTVRNVERDRTSKRSYERMELVLERAEGRNMGTLARDEPEPQEPPTPDEIVLLIRLRRAVLAEEMARLDRAFEVLA